MPAHTPFTGTPAMRCASSTARWMLPTVFSRSTTTPRRSPSLGALPTPTTRSPPPPFGSAMMHEILVVPMSSPTNLRPACPMAKLTSSGVASTAPRARRNARLRGTHDDLMLVAQIHFLREGAAMLEIGQHHTQRGKGPRARRPGGAQHARAVHEQEARGAGVRDVELGEPPAQLELARRQRADPGQAALHR